MTSQPRDEAGASAGLSPVVAGAKAVALQMVEERGRGAVLVGVARVDAALETLLQALLAPASDKTDNLFQPDRPLGSLGAKVALARRLGLIDESVEKALNTLRKVRNAFAHSTGSASLAEPTHQNRLAEAYKQAQQNPLWGPLSLVLDSSGGHERGPIEPALRNYILLITILVAFLEATAQQLNPLKPPVLMSFGGIIKN